MKIFPAKINKFSKKNYKKSNFMIFLAILFLPIKLLHYRLTFFPFFLLDLIILINKFIPKHDDRTKY